MLLVFQWCYYNLYGKYIVVGYLRFMLSYKQEESCFNIKAIIILTIFMENIIMCTFDYEIIQGPQKQMDKIALDGPSL